jgi:hypothetical protein
MRRIRPERIFLVVVTPLVFGGGILSAVGLVAKNHRWMRFGFVIFLVGVAIASLPLVATLIYFGWQKLSRLFGRKAQ